MSLCCFKAYIHPKLSFPQYTALPITDNIDYVTREVTASHHWMVLYPHHSLTTAFYPKQAELKNVYK